MVDPSGLVERDIKRKFTVTGSLIVHTASVTVEAGNLSQEDTEKLMSGVGDGFFVENNGKNISANGKPVESNSGDEALGDKASVMSQVVGTAVAKHGSQQEQAGWARVKKIQATSQRSTTSIARIQTDINKPGYGTMTLFGAAFDGSPNVWGRSGLIHNLIHEMLHVTRPYSVISLYKGEAYNEAHGKMDEAAAQLACEWQLGCQQ